MMAKRHRGAPDDGEEGEVTAAEGETPPDHDAERLAAVSAAREQAENDSTAAGLDPHTHYAHIFLAMLDAAQGPKESE